MNTHTPHTHRINRRILAPFIRFMIIASIIAIAIPAYAIVPTTYTSVGPGDTYLALGNSLTTGEEASANDDGQPGYPETIYQELKQHYPAIQFKNVGKSGETSTSLIAGGQLQDAIAFIVSERAAGRRVGLVTLGIGGNDMLAILTSPDQGQLAFDTFKTNIETIVSQLMAELRPDGEVPRGDLILMDYYNPYPNLGIPPTGEKLTDIWSVQFNAAIKETAAKYNIPVAEVASSFSGNEAGLLFVNTEIYTNPLLLNPADPNYAKNVDFHPRAAGHQVIAEQFLTASDYFAPEQVQISGPTVGKSSDAYTFTTTISPTYASLPVAYTWMPTPTQQYTDTALYEWSEGGVYTITVTATNKHGSTSNTHNITVTNQLSAVTITGPGVGLINATLAYTANITPSFVTKPITYTWTPEPANGQGTASASYSWTTPTSDTIRVEVTNRDATVTGRYTVSIVEMLFNLLLPVVSR